MLYRTGIYFNVPNHTYRLRISGSNVVLKSNMHFTF